MKLLTALIPTKIRCQFIINQLYTSWRNRDSLKKKIKYFREGQRVYIILFFILLIISSTETSAQILYREKVSKLVNSGTIQKTGTLSRITTKVQDVFSKLDSVTVVDFTIAHDKQTNNKINRDVVSFLKHSEFIELTTNVVKKIAKEKPRALSVLIMFKGKKITLNLIIADLFNEGFKVLSNNMSESALVKSGASYQGIMSKKASIATFNFFEDEFSGMLCTETEGNINIGKLIIPGTNTHIIYTDKDFKTPILQLCQTKDKILPNISTTQLKANILSKNTSILPCFKVFWESRYDIYTSYGNNIQAVNDYIISIFNNFNLIYQNEGIGTRLNNIFIWTSMDPYGSGVQQVIDNFCNLRTNFGAETAMLLGSATGGGISANKNFLPLCELTEHDRHAYSGAIFTLPQPQQQPWPNYSYAAWVTSHETGHQLGSHHTHACVWGANHNQAIDGCSAVEGFCNTAPIPLKGTIMSYCSSSNMPGIDFTLGFGRPFGSMAAEPGNVIRSNFGSGCIETTCDGNNTCLDYFESNNVYTSSTLFFGTPYPYPLSTGTVDNNINANIGFLDDVDWYKVTLAACGSLTVSLSKLPYDYNIELYGPEGTNQPAIGKSYNTGTQNETINFQSTSSSATTYYLKVYSFNAVNFSNASCYNLRMQWTSATCNSTCISPSISSQPASKTVASPMGTSFSILANGSSKTYQWQKNTGSGWSDISNISPYSGALTPTLGISSTNVSMNGYQYHCKVSSSCTSVTATSNAATLIVNTASIIGCNNDFACSPKVLPISSSCVVASCTTVGATPPTSNVIYTSCANNPYQSGRYDDDVWFSITASNTSPITVKVNATSNLSSFDPVLGVYTNGCLSMVQINGGCSDNPIGSPEQITFTPVAGSTYLLRVFSYGMGSSFSGNFDICVTTIGQAAPADLIITNPQLSVNTLCAGDAINASFNIENVGSTTASTSVVKYFLSPDNTYSASDVLLGSTSVNSLASAGSIFYNKTLTIPSGTSSGTKYILIVADAIDDISEGTNGELNNLSANTIAINNCSGSADLTIKFNSFTPATITPGTNVLVNYTRQNLGTATASPIYIGVYISKDNVFDQNNDEFIRDWGAGSLSAGQSITDLLNFGIPDCYQCGTFYVFLVIDYQNDINETDNNNNTVNFPIQITGCVSCTYSIPATGINFQATGGSGNFNIATTQCCPWTATTNDNWITLIKNSGNGNGVISYSVSPCNSGGTRTGKITVAGKEHTITQNCIETCNASQSFIWGAQAGSSTYSEYAYDLITDISGNSYMTGSIQGSSSFGSGIILTTPSSSPDVFVSKHNALGQIQWAKNYGNISQEQGMGIAKDKNENIYVVGYFQNSVTFGTTILTSNISNNDAAFLIKLNPSGIIQWAKKINPTNIARCSGITVDNNDNIFVTGNYTDNSNGYSSFFISKYNTSGTQSWFQTIGTGPSFKSVSGIACDNLGNVFICGRFQLSLTLGLTTLTAIATTDGYISRLDANGNAVWAKQLSSPDLAQNALTSVAVDVANNIYTVGYVDSTATVGNISIPLSKGAKAIIIKFDQNGNTLWAKASTQGRQYPQKIIKTTDSSIYFTGYFANSLKIDSTIILSSGSNDGFIVRIDENEKVKWIKGFGAAQADEVYTIAVNNNSDVFVAGGFSGSVVYGSTTLTSSGSIDIFLAKFKQCDLPAANITYNGNLVLCAGQLLELSTGYCSKNSYQWLLNDIEIPGANNPSYGSHQTGQYKVRVSAFPGCETLSNQVSLIVNQPPPQPGAITGNTTVTNGQTVSYSINNLSVATGYNWQLIGGGTITSGQNTTVVTINWTTSGNYILKVSALNDCGTGDEQIQNITVSEATAVTNPDNSFLINVVPNPSPGEFYVSAKGIINKDIGIEVFDLLGQKIYTNQQRVRSVNFLQMINLRNVSNGVYYIKIIVDKKVYVRKILKQD